MRSKKIYIVLLMIICVLGGILVGSSQVFNSNGKVISSDKKSKIYSNAISMMYETSDGSGVYEENSNSSWPSEGYTFNSVLSKCENGSTLSWDESTKKVKMIGNVSDKCYVYFDKFVPNITNVCANGNVFENCIINLGKLYSNSSTNIYHHDSSLLNGANDGSYRYAGSYESVKNYVCFGSNEETCPYDNLYRIIGVFNNQVKLIKADYAKVSELGTSGDNAGNYRDCDVCHGTSKGKNLQDLIGVYYWSKNKSDWNNSYLNNVNLNSTFLNTLDSTWQSKISLTSWLLGGNTYEKIRHTTPAEAYKNEIKYPATSATSNGKIGLIYVSDYYFAADPSNWTKYGYTFQTEPYINGEYGEEYDYRSAKDQNWMYMGLKEWTITTPTDDESRKFFVSYSGEINGSIYYQASGNLTAQAIRPVFYLNANSIHWLKGNGTFSDPMRIN